MKITVEQLRRIVNEEIIYLSEKANKQIRNSIDASGMLAASDKNLLNSTANDAVELAKSRLLLQIAQRIDSMKSRKSSSQEVTSYLLSQFSQDFIENLEDVMALLTLTQYESLAYNLTSRDEDSLTGETIEKLAIDPVETVKIIVEDSTYINSMSLWVLSDQLKKLHAHLEKMSRYFSGKENVSQQSIKAAMSQPDKKRGVFSFLSR